MAVAATGQNQDTTAYLCDLMRRRKADGSEPDYTPPPAPREFDQSNP